ncbi:MAG: hypothetical protein AB7R89_06285 [Dehalococcoidia bacterium]
MDGHTSFGWCPTHGIASSACPCPKPEAKPPTVLESLRPPGYCVICHSYTERDDVVLAWPNGAVLCLWCLDREGDELADADTAFWRAVIAAANAV